MFVVNVLDHLFFDTPPKSGATQYSGHLSTPANNLHNKGTLSKSRISAIVLCGNSVSFQVWYTSFSASLLVINITTASWAHLEKMVIGASQIAVLCNFYILAGIRDSNKCPCWSARCFERN